MLNKELEEFKKLYSEYITFVAEFHNAYQAFAKKPSHRSYRQIKGCLYNSKIIHKKLQHICSLAFREALALEDPDKPVSRVARTHILKQKETNIKIVNLLEKEPYSLGLYHKIAAETGVPYRRVSSIHKRLQAYKQVLFNDDKQK